MALVLFYTRHITHQPKIFTIHYIQKYLRDLKKIYIVLILFIYVNTCYTSTKKHTVCLCSKNVQKLNKPKKHSISTVYKHYYIIHSYIRTKTYHIFSFKEYLKHKIKKWS